MPDMNQIKIKIAAIMLLLCVCTVWLAKFEIRESSQNVSGHVTDAVTQNKDEPENLYARSAVLMDADSGRVLFGKDEDIVRPMASTTKIMTCIVALEHMTDNQTVTVSEYASGQPKVHLGVRLGQQFYLKDLLYSLMLESHNDSAVMVAEGIAGSVEAFTRMMNEKAEELGLEHTHFVTPNGLDGKDTGGIHATTARELALMMKYCIMDSPEKDQFLEITGTKEYEFQDVEKTAAYICHNHNAFLTMMDGALSGKTGFTADAGYCYVGALKKDDRTFIVSLLACGWPNNKGYKWSDTRKLMEYGLENYFYKNVWQDFEVQQILVKDSGDDQNIYQKNAVAEVEIAQAPETLKVLLKHGENVKSSLWLKSTLHAPVKKGQKVGELCYVLDKKVIAKYDIITRNGLKKRTFRWCLEQSAKCFLPHGKIPFCSWIYIDDKSKP